MNSRIIRQKSPIIQLAAARNTEGAAPLARPVAAITISLAPTPVSLMESQTQQFTASLTGTINTAVTWSLNPPVGTINSSGLYTAPAVISTAQTVTVTATSGADTTKSTTATVNLMPVSVSLTLSSMGCEKFQKTPGSFETSRFMAAISSTLLLRKTGRH